MCAKNPLICDFGLGSQKRKIDVFLQKKATTLSKRIWHEILDIFFTTLHHYHLRNKQSKFG
jgi:hypothetical protein